MSDNTLNTSRPESLGTALLTECLVALGQASAGRLDPEAASGLALRLGAAMARRAVSAADAGAKGGPLGGRPKGRSAWYRVEDGELGTGWTQDLHPVAAYLGLSFGSLGVYLTRGKGRYDTRVARDGREVLFSVFRTEPEQQAALKERQPEPWSAPASTERKPFSKPVPRRKLA